MTDASDLALPPHSSSVWPVRDDQGGDGVPVPRSADVVVVGAGIAGLAAAAQLSTEGVDVVVLDTSGVGSGATGRSSAKVSVLQETLIQEIAERDGSDVATKYVQANEYGRRWIEQQVKDESIDCDWTVQRAITYVADPGNRRLVEREAAVLRAAGVEASVVEIDLPYETGGAVVVDGQGQIDPVRFLGGLSDIVIGRGGSIHSGVRATGVRDGRSGVTVETTQGTIRARHVILATGLPFLDRGLFFARSVPQSSYVVACEVDELPAAGMYLSADDPKRSLRTAKGSGGRTLLLVGGEGHKTGQGGDTIKRQERLVAWADEHFGVRSVVHRFMAQDYMTPDRRPFVGPIHPGPTSVLVATGFNKWGFTNGAASASILTAHVTGSESPAWADAFTTSRLPFSGASRMLRAGVDVQKQMIEGWAKALVVRQHAEGREGEVVGRGVKPIAIGQSATNGEKPCAVSGVCPHLGGVVSWNSAEETWDCPLHGSRFERDGALLHGPAVDDLDSV